MLIDKITSRFAGKGWLLGPLLIGMSYFFAMYNPNQGFLQKDETQETAGIQIGWQLLNSYDYKNDVKTEKLQSTLGHQVKIPGFAVPLGGNMRKIGEFLLVPNPQACIHVPAPPPNLIVHVSVEETMSYDVLQGPVWVEGVLELKPSKSEYGPASFSVAAAKVSPYSAP